MALPAFFDLAPRITLRDPLAALLGASDDGLLVYGYADAVRLAGHSCPTVAGAWLMARAALRALYPDAPAERGGVSVQMGAPEQEGTTGVVGQVLTLVTGAAAANGFHGIGGRFVRQGLLRYATDPMPGVRFQRRDTAQAVTVELDLSRVPPAPGLRERMAEALAPSATADQRRAFGELWQDRVRRLLLEHADDPAMVRVEAPA
ncbi:FmdE family protein [Frateuria sp. GZRR35]|uniref:FmdE family protein n=1 Tax=Frateuria sp. GZRR35 TaxID=3351536 RepID=UPI003EDC31C2